MKTIQHVFLYFFSLCLCLNLPAQSSPKTIDYPALASFPSPRSLEISSDGHHLLYSTFQTDPQNGSLKNETFIMNLNDNKSRPLPADMMSVHFSPDGRSLTYVTRQGNQDLLCKMNLNTGKTEAIGPLPTGALSYQLLPDCSGLLYTGFVYAVDFSPEYAAKQDELQKKSKYKALTYDHLLMRPYFRWDDGKVSHIFLYRFDSRQSVDLTPGPHSAPTSHLGSRNDLALSPDGRTLAYTSNTDAVKALSTNNDIYLVDIENQNRRLLTPSKGNDCGPVFSPDGRYLAYSEMPTPGYESEQQDLIVIDLKNDTRRNLTRELDLPVGQIIWSKKGDSLFCVCKEKGYDSLYRVSLANGRTICLVRNRTFSALTIAPDEKNFFCITSCLDRPPEIARFDIKQQHFVILTHFTDEFTRTYALGKSEVIWFQGGKGDSVMAFLTLPPNFDSSKKYPLVFLIHGGPELDWDGSWSSYGGNSQHFAANDYIVVKPNLHAAPSYGRSFHEAIQNNWGIIDQADIEACIDYLCTNRPYIDAKRIGAMGRSYGGFLVNWLNGNSDRFACFVSIDGCFDQLMMYYSTDELWFPEKEFGGSPIDNRAEYLRASPSTYVKNFKTPTLVLHGGRDYRVDLSQGIGMFTALQRQGVPSRLIVFPDEGHYYRSQDNWEYAYQEIFVWLERYLKK